MRLFDYYEKYLLKYVNEPLSQTHSEFFLDILREYDDGISSLIGYGAISYNDNYVMIGNEYEYDKLNSQRGQNAEQFYDLIVSPDRKPVSLLDLYYLANDNTSEHIYIPVYVDHKMLFCVCNREKEKLLAYLGIKSGEEIYEKYPLLISILNWGISYMIPSSPQERIEDKMLTEFEQSKNYIRIKTAIVNKVFEELYLPYPSTIHSVAGWKYEGKANQGYVDFYNPFDAKRAPKPEVSFKNKYMLSARNARTLRKYIELTSDKLRLKAISSRAYISGYITDDEYWSFAGLGGSEDNCYATIRFEGNAKWRLITDNEVVFYDGSTYTFERKMVKNMPYKYMTYSYYKEIEWITGKFEKEKVEIINAIIEMASRQKHGTMVIFSPDASKEADRLCKCGRGIEVMPINFFDLINSNRENAEQKLLHMSKIDGAMLFDEEGVCYSIGTIVDGRACENSNPGRGARYNSGYTYVNDCNDRGIQCYCAVISEDETIDVFGLFGKENSERIFELIKSGKRVETSI